MKNANCKINSPVESPQKLSLRAERSNLAFCKCLISWDCGACSELREESPGLLRLRLATATLLAMTTGWTSYYGFINVGPSGRTYD